MLVGREAELDRIDAVLAGARAGGGAVLVLTGEPGVGKSALLEAAAGRGGDMRLLRAAGAEHEAELPFSGIHELLHPVLGLIGELPAPQAGALRGALAMSDEPVERFAVSAAVLGLLGAAAAEAPLLVCVDDAQWIDSASLEALGFAARRVRRAAVLIAFRDEVVPSFRASRFELLALGGLAQEAIAALVGGAAERPLSSNLVTRVARATQGNPLAALEVAAAVSDSRLAGRIGLGEPLPPGRLISHAFERRLGELSEPARRALALAAAGESDGAHVILDAAQRLGLPADAFAEAERAGALAVAEDRLRFRHPLLRSLAYARAGAEQRRAAHAALAAALPAGPGTAGERRAWHLAAATVAPDEGVAATLAAAAERFAQRTGYHAAAYAYERAAELTPAAPRRAERLVAAAEASRLGGRPAHARELLMDAAPLVQDVALRDEVALKDAMLEAWLGSVAVAAERYAAIAEDVMERDPDRGAYALSLAAGTWIAAGDTGAALVSARRAAGLLPGASEATACTVRETLGTVLVLRGEPAEGAPLLREAAAWFEREGELPGRDYVAQALLWLGDHELARRLLDPLLVHADQVGDIRALTSALEVHAQLELRTGCWREAHAAAAESVRLSEDTGLTVQLAYSLAVLAIVEAALGEPAAVAHATEADEIAARNRLTVIAEYTGAARGHAALAAGRPTDAVAELTEVARRVDRTGRRLPGVLQWEADLLEAAVRAEQTDTARRGLAELDRAAIETGHAWATVVAARIAGMLADEHRPHFETALRLHETAAAPFEAARTRFCFGQRLRRDGARIEAREQLRAAAEGFRAIGAKPWTEAAERELGATGERLRRRAPEAPEELTTQERAIAELVAAGASNKDVAAELFLSPKTVEAHLTRIYRKLGVNSRTQLARQLERTPAGPG
ncbi:MAG TPA: AAA family ATPase [Solirubrobacteraceae bacterium]|nr:AAA family ATPase [Solirubrobacteraceae bacterium]